MVASTIFSGVPAFAKEGTAPKIGIFTSSDLSSPFTDENREDPLYSPYSAYGNGEKAVYKKNSPAELKKYSDVLAEGV